MLVLVFKRDFFFFFVQVTSRLMTKPTNWHVRPARLGIRPVWSESSLSARSKLGSLATHWAHSKDSDQTGWMPMLIWVFAGRTDHFVGFVMGRLILCRYQSYQVSHISCSKNKSSIQKVPAVCSFCDWYCLPNLAKLFYGGSRKYTKLYWTTGDVPGRCLVVIKFEIAVYCQ